MVTTVQILMSNWKQFEPIPKQTRGDLAGQELDGIALKREQLAAQPRAKCRPRREARRWLSFQPWGCA